MKALSTAMISHLAQEVTSLCTCWKIIRKDGTVFGFTDHDVDLIYNGDIYESETGYNRTAISGDASFSVDNLDVTGFLDSKRITENDLRNGLFDMADVYIFAVNWQDLTMGDIKLRRGFFGEVSIHQNGMFEVEIRGLHQALSFNFMEVYQPLCRADFCDARCKLNKATYTFPGTVFSSTTRDTFRASSLPVVVDSGVTTKGAHRYWRIQVDTPNSTDYAGFAEIVFFDQAKAIISGGSATAISTRKATGQFLGLFGTSYGPGNARDGNTASSWECKQGDAPTAWWQIDFGSAKDVRSVLMRVSSTDYTHAPTAFDLQYSDDGVSFTSAKLCTNVWKSNGQEATWNIASATSDAVDFPTTLTAVPPPSTGASTYVGGTITFTSGPNTGRSLEIISYDPATYTVGLFEAFAYPISQGDKFLIMQGCDKSFATCKVYGNQINFRGEPHVPGQDEMLKYPDAHS